MASSESGEDESNSALGLLVVSRKKNFPESQITNPLLAKSVRSGWLDIGLVFLRVSVHKHAKKNEVNIQPS